MEAQASFWAKGSLVPNWHCFSGFVLEQYLPFGRGPVVVLGSAHGAAPRVASIGTMLNNTSALGQASRSLRLVLDLRVVCISPQSASAWCLADTSWCASIKKEYYASVRNPHPHGALLTSWCASIQRNVPVDELLHRKRCPTECKCITCSINTMVSTRARFACLAYSQTHLRRIRCQIRQCTAGRPLHPSIPTHCDCAWHS
jgi:hypothetical protein